MLEDKVVGRWGASQAPEGVSISPEDIPAIRSYIEDERKDEEKYRVASTTLKSPEGRELAARLSVEEARHRALWEELLNSHH
jgi:rubrerythrin